MYFLMHVGGECYLEALGQIWQDFCVGMQIAVRQISNVAGGRIVWC